MGAGIVTAITGAAIEALLERAVGKDLAIVLSPIVAGFTYNLETICSEDPPADPGLTALDVGNALNYTDWVIQAPAVDKVRQWFLSHYWYFACQCTSTNTPPPPPLSNPTGVSTNPGLPSGGTGRCWEIQGSWSIINPSSGIVTTDLTPVFLPLGDTIQVISTVQLPTGFAHSAVAIPSDTTSFNFTTQNVGAAEPSPYNDVFGYMEFWNAAGVQQGQFQFLSGQSVQIGPYSPHIAVPTGATHVSLFSGVSFDTAVVGQLMNWQLDLWTNCPGTDLSQPCCPPDPLLEIKLNQILGLLEQLMNVAPPPTGWADATVHTGISGTGNFQLGTNVTGLRATFTAIPSDIRITPGTPPFYWSLGFVTPVAIDVPLRSLRTVFATQAMQLPAHTTAIDYTFPAGVVVTLTELVPA